MRVTYQIPADSVSATDEAEPLPRLQVPHIASGPLVDALLLGWTLQPKLLGRDEVKAHSGYAAKGCCVRRCSSAPRSQDLGV